jgi:hypothetical protein
VHVAELLGPSRRGPDQRGHQGQQVSVALVQGYRRGQLGRADRLVLDNAETMFARLIRERRPRRHSLRRRPGRGDEVLRAGLRTHHRHGERELEDLVEVVVGVGDQIGMRDQQRAAQPTRIDADHHREQWQGQQQVHGLEHLDDLARRASVEIVDVQHDAFDRALAGSPGIGQPAFEFAQVSVRRGQDAQVT